MEKSGMAPMSNFGQISEDKIMLSVTSDKSLAKAVMKNGIFAINYIESKYLKDVEHCGLTSGIEKFDKTEFTPEKGINDVPLIKESPVSLECKVIKTLTIDNETVFIAKIIDVKTRDNKNISWLVHAGDNYLSTVDMKAKVLKTEK